VPARHLSQVGRGDSLNYLQENNEVLGIPEVSLAFQNCVAGKTISYCVSNFPNPVI
jgi:hypothetical protein